jgi:hypothetical protein
MLKAVKEWFSGKDSWPLHEAVEAGDLLGVTIAILDHASDLNKDRKAGWWAHGGWPDTPLLLALSRPNLEIVKELVAAGATVGRNEHCRAASKGTVTQFEFIRSVVAVELMDYPLETDGMVAVVLGGEDDETILAKLKILVPALNAQVARLGSITQDSETMFLLAARRGHAVTLRYLLDLPQSDASRFIAVNTPSLGGGTPLSGALSLKDHQKRFQIVTMLVEAGADVNMRTILDYEEFDKVFSHGVFPEDVDPTSYASGKTVLCDWLTFAQPPPSAQEMREIILALKWDLTDRGPAEDGKIQFVFVFCCFLLFHVGL